MIPPSESRTPGEINDSSSLEDSNDPSIESLGIDRDFATQPTWLHPTSLIFDLISHIRQLIVPMFIAVYSAAKGDKIGIYFGLAVSSVAILVSAFRYFTLRYKIVDGELIVKKGLVFRRIRTVPINRIQNMDLLQNPLHRIFNVAEVKIETASGTEPEAVLRVLSIQKFNELRQQIFNKNEGVTSPNTIQTDDYKKLNVEESAAQTKPPLIQIPASWLIKAGLASNRGLIFVGIAAGAISQFRLEDKVDLDQFKKLLPAFDGSIENNLKLLGIALAIFLFLRILGVIWYWQRFHNYQLIQDGDDFRISCGFFTKITATVPRHRIQFISIHRPLLLRWMDMASIRIETAGGGGATGQDQSNSRRWFVPVLPEEKVIPLIDQLRDGLHLQTTHLDWQPLSPRAGQRMIRLSFIWSLIFAGIGGVTWPPWGWLAGFAALPLLMVWAAKKSKSMKYARTAEAVIYRSGVLNHKTSLTFWDKVQTVSVHESPFDRRWDMGSLQIDTAAAGPAEHTIRVKYLNASFADDEYQMISRTSAQHEPDFG